MRSASHRKWRLDPRIRQQARSHIRVRVNKKCPRPLDDLSTIGFDCLRYLSKRNLPLPCRNEIPPSDATTS
ncbi:hypothetical protein C7A11_13030 [Pseudomonas simiae]|nr:hypothetical protein C7A11_13030 [Pseudomonas simiae]